MCYVGRAVGICKLKRGERWGKNSPPESIEGLDKFSLGAPNLPGSV